MTTVDEVIKLYEQVLSGELSTFPLHFWKGAEAISYAAILTRYFIDKTGLDPTEATKKSFRKSKLGGVVHLFGGSTFQIIENAYPGVYKPWELKFTPRGFWTGDGYEERCREATQWMCDDKLRLKLEDIPNVVGFHTFFEHGLAGMIQNSFGYSLFKAIDNAYPGVFKPWEIRRSELEWTPALAAEAMFWMVREKMGIGPEEIVDVTHQDIVKHNLITLYRLYGLSRMLDWAFGNTNSKVVRRDVR